MAQSREYPDLAFVPPRAWGMGRDGHSVQYLVIHHTAGSERSTSAEDGAAYDARRTDGVSTHYFVDSNSVVQCVYTLDRANAAHFYGNRKGVQYELCGTMQSREQWLDAASDPTLTNAARQAARDCAKYGLPVRKLTPAQMRAGEKGICGHWDVTLAYGLGDHTDPGPNFPWDIFLDRVRQFMGGSDDMDTRQESLTVEGDLAGDKNVLHYRLRAIQDARDPELTGRPWYGAVLAKEHPVGLRQLADLIGALGTRLAAIEQRLERMGS